MGRRLVIGDIHGAARALRQCLERSSFNKTTDLLICLGDVCDGWPETKQAIDELLTINNLIYILGNHDLWTREWMHSGHAEPGWLVQGGHATVLSFHDNIPEPHHALLSNAFYHYELENRLFVHAGINPDKPLDRQGADIFLWDRKLANKALLHEDSEKPLSGPFDEIYVGHTPIDSDQPLFRGGIWMMDTGAGWSGVLSIMDIDTKEVFTSDPVPQLYPGVIGRTRF